MGMLQSDLIAKNTNWELLGGHILGPRAVRKSRFSCSLPNEFSFFSTPVDTPIHRCLPVCFTSVIELNGWMGMCMIVKVSYLLGHCFLNWSSVSVWGVKSEPPGGRERWAREQACPSPLGFAGI